MSCLLPTLSRLPLSIKIYQARVKIFKLHTTQRRQILANFMMQSIMLGMLAHLHLIDMDLTKFIKQTVFSKLTRLLLL